MRGWASKTWARLSLLLGHSLNLIPCIEGTSGRGVCCLCMNYSIQPALRPYDAGQPVITRARSATSFVRSHAINTGDISSIRLVRLLQDASTLEQKAAASTAFHYWADRLHLGRPST